MDVHHQNGIPWDNRPENLGILDHAEHSSLHGSDSRPDEARLEQHSPTTDAVTVDEVAPQGQHTLVEWAES